MGGEKLLETRQETADTRKEAAATQRMLELKEFCW
jgi:hypothetical protein